MFQEYGQNPLVTDAVFGVWRLEGELEAERHRIPVFVRRPVGLGEAAGEEIAVVINELAARFQGEVPGMTVARPRLEDVYLRLIQADDPATAGDAR